MTNTLPSTKLPTAVHFSGLGGKESPPPPPWPWPPACE